MKKIFRTLATIPILIYQKTLSPDHGIMRVFYPHGACRYYPTCSEYTRQSVLKYGIIKGYYNGLRRILKCNPWSDGGVDRP
ncbi:membrane protein insertion efficiency factor YidD [Candidatus Uhrbacteria bacterium CG_4_9_14_0_2_um_filter_41_50]|uniref:Putative membrane protein insertion efficiency factor n=1 Tax=Candidatus Uhrbacteria bacterium CG_4_9_14_0_2_um_filter_41_50 TaxID=1975031 RepID=A0A2M8EN99_9BACT|nr:MAG: membrane protein insertion efficiency factor YidD [Candidatus Uhrbacteria bacterium CG_4_10_14_3_um_filter_41_21]PIZ55189.1 MAG: membrane protein insertion efficiency factor YidD [Candidatus Uhrbacteria bacterium CG_4_10_14_0_2_um_filter_41_21]PJB84897.1 MAG: membrane protein insertion efficiency factor YidD [Candidatus Uhrbacteria bacterium CG_4_9_14_0_8_um_filter_41_16]PJC24157.1 MAG: membrane protein insertion efficiency factor YidD [Candidatus Uhrbacteria bacterium CG_4_9_14_0_2_um_f